MKKINNMRIILNVILKGIEIILVVISIIFAAFASLIIWDDGPLFNSTGEAIDNNNCDIFEYIWKIF